MDLSGLRETISTREKIFPARSRMVGSVSGKSIIVPRIVPLGWETSLRASYHFSAAKVKSAGVRTLRFRGFACRISRCKRGQFPGGCHRPLKCRSRSRGGPVCPPPRDRKLSLRRAPRLALGFRAEGVRGEEALHRESSVFRDGRTVERVVLANRCNPFGRQSHPRS